MVRNTLPRPGVVRTEFSIVNGSQTRAQGAEIGWRASWGRRWERRGSSSYQRLSSNPDGQVTRNGTPQHKGSLFLRFRDRGIAFDGGVHRVGRTKWNSNRLTTDVPRTLSVDPYTLVQMSVAYEFVGRWRGLRISVLAFNLLGQDHEELLVSPQPLVLAQSGRSIGSRRALRISYAW